MDEGKKNVLKVLTTNDIRQHAREWTLAGDVGLLAHLEQFSEDICNKTKETQKHLTELTDSYEEVFTKVGNITNQFLALQNCQFVENRVYDEDTPTEEKQEVKKELDDAEKERLLLNQYKEAVELGLKLLDTHFQEVQLPPNSDSEEEDDGSAGNSFIWKPKNPYAGKKFPLLIGSSEWWADDHVGLRVGEENLDTEKTISESESDFESPQVVDTKTESSLSVENERVIPTKPTFMDSSSEDLFGLQKEDDYQNDTSDIFTQGKNSILEKPPIFSPLFENQADLKAVDGSVGKIQVPEEEIVSSTENQNNKPQKMDNDFTRELMAKLVSVTKKNDNVDVEKPEQPAPMERSKEKSPSDQSLFDETDDSSDLFTEKIKPKVKNSNLFFESENDDQLFSGSNNLLFKPGGFESEAQKPEPKTFNPIKDSVYVSNQKKESTVFKKPTLFEDIDDEDTLFSSKPVENKQKNLSFSSTDSNRITKPQPEVLPKTEKGLFDEFNDDFEDDLLKPKLFDNKVNKNVEIIASKESKNKENKPTVGNASLRKMDRLEDSTNQTPKNLSKLPFESKHSENVFNVLPSDKKISFVEAEDDQDDLFSSSFKDDSLFKGDKKLSSSAKGLSAVVDDDDISLFVDKPKQPDTLSISSSRSSLFDEVSASKSKLASVFEKDKASNLEDDLFNVSDNSLFGESSTKTDNLFSSKSATKIPEKGKSSLFDDFDDSDDLFGPLNVSQPKSRDKQLKDSAEKKQPSGLFGEDTKKLSKSLFLDDTDDDLFRTSTDSKVAKSEGKATEIPKETKSELFKEVLATKPHIFSELDDDDELFGGAKTESVKPKTTLSDVELFGNDIAESAQPKISGSLEPELFSDDNSKTAKPNISSRSDDSKFTESTKPIIFTSLDDPELFVDDLAKAVQPTSEIDVEILDGDKSKLPKSKISSDLEDDELFKGCKSKFAQPEISTLNDGEFFAKGKPEPVKSKILGELDDAELFGNDKAESVKSKISSNLEDPELFEVDKARLVQREISSQSNESEPFAEVNDKPVKSKIFSGLDEPELFGNDKAEPAKSKISSGLDDELFMKKKSLSKKSSELDDDELFGNKMPSRLEDSESLVPTKPSKLDNAKLFTSDIFEFAKPKISSELEAAELFSGEAAKPVKPEIPSQAEDPKFFVGVKTKPKTSSNSEQVESVTKADPLKNKVIGRLGDAEYFAGEKSEPIKPKPPDSLSLKTEEKVVKSVGKLNIPDNLKFKFESMAKNISSGETRPKEEKKTVDADFFEPPSNLLKCPSKDRVKIPVKRRPQSRRARQEAIRNSGTNFGVDFEDEKPVLEAKSESTISSKEPPKDPMFFSPVPSNPLSPSTDEEDYFNVPELDTNFEKEDQSIFENNLFQSSSNSKTEDLLFDKAPVLSPLKSKKNLDKTEGKDSDSLFTSQTKPVIKKISIFDDEDDVFEDDDSLFKTPEISIKTPEVSVKTQNETPKVKNLFESQTSNSSSNEKAKKSLFGEDFDDEDDLFGSNSNPVSVTVPKQKSSKSDEKSPQPKEKENPGFIDPLGLMSSDD